MNSEKYLFRISQIKTEDITTILTLFLDQVPATTNQDQRSVSVPRTAASRIAIESTLDLKNANVRKSKIINQINEIHMPDPKNPFDEDDPNNPFEENDPKNPFSTGSSNPFDDDVPKNPFGEDDDD